MAVRSPSGSARRQRSAIYVRADVTSKASVESLVADTVREFGTVDILVNNAGLFADLADEAVPRTSTKMSGTA